MASRIFSLLRFRSKKLFRAITAERRANDDDSHQTSDADAAPLPRSIPPIAPAKITETKVFPEKTVKPKTHNRSPHTGNPLPPPEHKRIRDMERQIDKLRRENAYLHKKIAELTAEKRATGTDEIADRDVRHPENDTAYDRLLAAYDLPRKTVVSRGGWTKEMSIAYSQERDAFCDAFQKKYTEEERGRFAETIRRFAQEGPHRLRNSLKTKILRRDDLPGTPRDANYSRATHELRFTWKQIGDVLWIFCVYKHTSGPANALHTIK